MVSFVKSGMNTDLGTFRKVRAEFCAAEGNERFFDLSIVTSTGSSKCQRKGTCCITGLCLAVIWKVTLRKVMSKKNRQKGLSMCDFK